MACLQDLLARGDRFWIENGRFKAKTVSGKEVPPEYRSQIITEMSQALFKDWYRYDGFSTGLYGDYKKYSGVCLRFKKYRNDEDVYAAFNAEVRRVRNTSCGRKGEMLAGKRFVPPKTGAFAKFWKRCDLPPPRRNSEYWTRMGKAKDVTYSAQQGPNSKLVNETIKPVNVSAKEVCAAVLGGK